MKNIILLILLMSPYVAFADSDTPPPGYWSYDGQTISFCFQFNQEDICSKLPMDELRKIILESNSNKEKTVSSALKLDEVSSTEKIFHI